ncbi:rod shape-determining protein MreC [Chitinimonas sp. BJYL2]|uniref:rod shape-determining protein MreC n=1 Tax=Chitinimonas sp. BJYL2 TaxID=2976696 RepID=UPI0022B5B9DE|nr:rod shape-determining protein MreC [Chitinimonas sp. BJYL2]
MAVSHQPVFFKQGPRPHILLMIYASLSAVLLLVDVRWHVLQPVRELVSMALYPLQRAATAPVAAARTAGDFLTSQTKLLQENRRLEDERLRTSAELLRLNALREENAQLRRLTATRDSQHGKGVLAEVLYNDRDPYTAKLVVDRGETTGANLGQVVIDPRGVVGQITRAQPLTSEITLITHRDHTVPVQVVRNGLRAIIYGQGNQHPMIVRWLPLNADIQEGDELVTSGIDGTYPAGLPVARVVKVDRNPGVAFAQVRCAPAADIDKHRFLLILDETRPLPPRPADADAAVAKPAKEAS